MTVRMDMEIEEIRREMITIAPFLNEPERTDFSRFLETFREGLPLYTEVSISPHDSTVSLMTRGAGEEFERIVKNHLITAGMSERCLDIFDKVSLVFPGVKLLVKQDFAEKPLFDFSIYWQHLITARIFFQLVRKSNVPMEPFKDIPEYELLTRNQTMYAGLSFSPPDEIQFRIIFSNNLEKSSSFLAPGVAALMARIGLDANSINYFISYHNYLVTKARGNLFTSIGFGDSGPVGVKVDYEVIPPEHAIEIMKSQALPPKEGLRMARTMKTMGMSNLTYLGIRFSNHTKPTLKFYYDRRFSEKNRDNPRVLADIVQNTIWIP